MTSLTGRNTRTIVGYLNTLLDYPRWFIEREVDFTDCHLAGGFDATDTRCASCVFGDACRWLNANLGAPSQDVPLDELVEALRTSVDFFRTTTAQQPTHDRDCQCDGCQWLDEASAFLRQHRHNA